MGGEACGDAVSDALPEGDKTNHDARVVARDSNLARACRERDAPDSSGSSHRRMASSESIAAATRAAVARANPRSRMFPPRPRAARPEVRRLSFVFAFSRRVCTDCIEPA